MEQTKQLDSWAAKRDSILGEIAVLRTEKEKEKTEVTNLAQSKTSIYNDIQQGIGRLEEIKKQEAERASLLPKEISDLEVKKTGLETNVTALQGDVKELEEKKSSLLRDVANITAFHDHVHEKALGLENIVATNLGLSDENSKKFIEILNTAGLELQRVIDIGEQNVEKTNKMIGEIPKMIVEMHRGIIERRNINKVRGPQNHDISS